MNSLRSSFWVALRMWECGNDECVKTKFLWSKKILQTNNCHARRFGKEKYSKFSLKLGKIAFLNSVLCVVPNGLVTKYEKEFLEFSLRFSAKEIPVVQIKTQDSELTIGKKLRNWTSGNGLVVVIGKDSAELHFYKNNHLSSLKFSKKRNG